MVKIEGLKGCENKIQIFSWANNKKEKNELYLPPNLFLYFDL